MQYKDTTAKLVEYRRQIADIRKRMREVQSSVAPEEVRDYELATPQGTVRLSELFGDKPDLIVIHNMGASCPYCTLWADGYNGIYHHLVNRAAFAVSSPDSPAAQEKFAASRGWQFRMVSHQGTTFAEDMGYRSKQGGWLPGLSAFKREGRRILRVSDAAESPGDDFCSLWHIFELLPEGAGNWAPKIQY